jgi:cyclopropane-fatty-acyl-phospholipid synthase
VTGITNSRFANTITNSLTNIRAHYDLSNAMFAQFLSADMTYSCGIFRDLDADLRKINGQSANGRKSKSIKANGESRKGNGYSTASASTSDTDGDEGSTVVDVDELEEAQLAKLR